MTMKFKPVALDKLTGEIQKNAKRGELVKTTIHRDASSVLYWWFNKKLTATEAAEYMNMIAAGHPYHAKFFNTWVRMKTGLQWSEEKSCWFGHKNQRLKETVYLDARDNPFWEVAPKPDAKPFNVFDAIEAILSTVERRQKKHVDGDLIDMETVRKLRDVVKHREEVEAKLSAETPAS